jgi:membrane protease YdiL (CAAX protease family)
MKKLTARQLVWPAYLVAALLLLGMGNGTAYGIIVPLAALVLAIALRSYRPRPNSRVDRLDLAVIAGLYLAVVGLFSLAFRVFTQANTAGLFLTFGAGLLLGVVGPIVYTVWIRGRALAEVGLTRANLARSLVLGVVLAGVQFFLTLWGYQLPRPVDWVPLVALALTVGFFESVFFRGFVQNRLHESLGPVGGVGGSAVLYALYHVGYGMGASEMLFLFGLGVVYSVAFATVRNVLVLWPLLVPLGSFYSNLAGGGIQMPWESILGFVDVLALMMASIWLAARRQRRNLSARRGGLGTPGPALP